MPAPQRTAPVSAKNDRDLLPLAQVQAFRKWLEKHGCDTRAGNPDGGQHFHVRTTRGWAVVQRGKNGTVVTAVELRKVVQEFMRSPLARSVAANGWITSTRQLFVGEGAVTPANDAVNLSALVARQVPAQTQADVDAAWKRDQAVADATVAALNAGAQRSPDVLSIDPAAPGADKTVTTHMQGGQVVGTSSEMTFGRLVRDGLSAPAPAVAPKQSAHQEFLTDLRDDFAINAPLTMREDESLAAFCKRRWEYATLMVANRPNEYRG